MKTFNLVVILSAALVAFVTSGQTLADSFGSGANAFDVDFVSIGNPANAADTTGKPNPAGAVPYVYNMGKYEISRDMITKASNLGNLEITLQDMTTFGGNGLNRPASGVSWNEAARFVNWLNTSTGSPPAYKFTIQPGDPGYFAAFNGIQLWTPSDAGYNPNNPYRNSLAHYFLPNVDEWYKAAYYDPTSDTYYDYPTGSNSSPSAVASGTTAGTAVYDQPVSNGPADITAAGGLSAYGTMGQGGNVYEWEELDPALLDEFDHGLALRRLRGGPWAGTSNLMLASMQFSDSPTTKSRTIGFRIASAVPEPTSGVLILMGSMGCCTWHRRTARNK